MRFERGRGDGTGSALRWVPAIFAAAAVLAVPADRGTAAFPGASGEIAFATTRDGNYEIYVIDPATGEQTRFTDNQAADLDPAWSGDGRRLAFVSDRDGNYELYVMNADGSAQTRVTADPASDADPAWSPDGTQLAFTSGRDGNDEVYVANADGSRPTRLTTVAGAGADGDPAWSPDGRWIAFASERSGTNQIYVMTAFGAEQTRLTTHSGSDVSPSWSPHGRQIAFASNRDGTYEIYVMNADGSGQRRLTRNVAADLDPAWSPDGRQIAFTSRRNGNAELYVMNADGSAQTRLTANAAEEATPDWQPLALPPPVVGNAFFRARWRESVLSGTLTLRGNVSAPVAAGAVLRRGTNVRMATRLDLPGGAFSRTVRLPRTLLPGTYALVVTPESGPTPFSPQTLRLELPAPPEGVVRSAYASAEPTGAPRRRFSRGASLVFAQFRFAVRPRPGRIVTVAWYRPGGRLAGPVRRKPPSALVSAFVGGRRGAPLPPGVWRVVVRAGPTVVKRLSFRIG